MRISRILALVIFVTGVVAKPEPKPIVNFVAMFTTVNCPACEQMKPLVQALNKAGFPITIIQNAHLARSVGVTGFPTFVGVVKGRIVSSHLGACTTKQLIELLPRKYHPVDWRPAPASGPGVKSLPDPSNV